MRKLGRIKKFGIEWLGWHGAFDGIYGGYNSKFQYLNIGPVMLTAYWKIPRADVAGQFCSNSALDWPEWRRMLLAAWISDHSATVTALLENGPQRWSTSSDLSEVKVPVPSLEPERASLENVVQDVLTSEEIKITRDQFALLLYSKDYAKLNDLQKTIVDQAYDTQGGMNEALQPCPRDETRYAVAANVFPAIDMPPQGNAPNP
jgi:hypothetical protein